MLYCMLLWFGDHCQNVNAYTVRLSFRLHSRHGKFIKVSLLCWEVFLFPLWWDFNRRRKHELLWLKAFLCVSCIGVWVRVNGRVNPRGLTISYFCPMKKVEYASPSLWKFHTTPSWRIMTKSSNNSRKRKTLGQSSSLPVKKTYGERDTFWLHTCCSDVLMTCHIEVFIVGAAALKHKPEAHRLCLLHKHTYDNKNTNIAQRRYGNTDCNKAAEVLFHSKCPLSNVYIKKHRIKHLAHTNPGRRVQNV